MNGDTNGHKPTFNEAHWNAFVECHLQGDRQGPVGLPPTTYRHILGADDDPLLEGVPHYKLARTQVRQICVDVRYVQLFKYVCVMAWGGHGLRFQKRHALAAWGQRAQLARRIDVISDPATTISAAYDLFSNENIITGLGPSFFTKLLFFLCPEPRGTEVPNRYIMDQWTARSINLLFQGRFVRMLGSAPTRLNSAGDYIRFCCLIERAATRFRCTGATMEERLFDRPLGAWREYVKANG